MQDGFNLGNILDDSRFNTHVPCLLYFAAITSNIAFSNFILHENNPSEGSIIRYINLQLRTLIQNMEGNIKNKSNYLSRIVQGISIDIIML